MDNAGKQLVVLSNRQAIERVELEDGSVELLASWDGTEIIRHSLSPGGRFGMRPQEGWEALEFLLVESGKLKAVDGSDLTLSAGDSLAAMPVREQLMFEATGSATFIYICSQPVFQFYSDELRELRQLAVQVETKDSYTQKHCSRLQNFSARVGESLSLPPSRLHLLLYGAFLHDVGKAKLPESILNKPSGLDPGEWALVKQHPTLGREMVEKTFIAAAGPIIEQHHERLDGSGYPHGLSGDDISLEAQIVAVVDSYDAMTTERPYSRARSKEEALEELDRCAGTLYRPDVIEAFEVAIA